MMDMDLETLAIDVRDLEGEGCIEPEAQALDGGEVRLIVHGCRRLRKTSDFFHTEDGGEPVCGLSANEVEELPGTLQNVQGEESEAAGADAHGVWRELIDVFAMEHIVLELGCGDEVWGCAIELCQQAHLADRRLLRAFTLATELQRGDHLLAQWCHQMSPFVT